MSVVIRRSILLLAGVFGALRAAAAEAPAPRVSDVIVELPPMIVVETISPTTWLHARIGRDEYLSRCSLTATQGFIASRERQRATLRAIVPDAFLANWPTLTLLYDAGQKPKPGDPIARDALRPPLSSGTKSGAPIRFLPNLRIDDRDLSASCVFIEDVDFTQRELLLSADFLRLHLERRVPMLPPWLIEGILGVHAQMIPGQSAITLRPLTWLSETESRALARDRSRPRALLPAGEMFAPDALRGPENQHARRAQILQAQVTLFVRWALDPRHRSREAFWEFARRAGEQRTTEGMFSRCFGFGFSDLRDRLADYLPIAVRESLTLEAHDASAPPFDLRVATPNEVVRLRAEWERLQVSHVQRTHPEFTARYLEQVRRTLTRGSALPDKEPSLLSTLGLGEIECGDKAAGLAWLTEAAHANTNRPRVYHELARLRFAALVHHQSATRLYSAAEIAPIVEPLRSALRQTPPLPEVFGLMSDAWIRCRSAPPPEDLAALAQGAKYFALRPAVAYRIALALARYGQGADATELLLNGKDYVIDEELRARYAQLLETLRAAHAAKP